MEPTEAEIPTNRSIRQKLNNLVNSLDPIPSTLKYANQVKMSRWKKKQLETAELMTYFSIEFGVMWC